MLQSGLWRVWVSYSLSYGESGLCYSLGCGESGISSYLAVWDMSQSGICYSLGRVQFGLRAV